MSKDRILKRTEDFVRKTLSKEGTGHDLWHIERVRNNARLINKTEKADAFIVELAALLHDIGDRKVVKKKDSDYSIAEKFLKRQKVSDDVIEQVMFIIKNLSFTKTLNTKRNDASREFFVVQDADRLDALGAIGIARAFTYGGSKSRMIYNPEKQSKKYKTSKEYKKGSASTLHHFEEKLLLLKDLMNTKTAKKIARERDRFMRNYLKQFFGEWYGKRKI